MTRFVLFFALLVIGSSTRTANSQFESLQETLSPDVQLEEATQSVLSQIQRADKFIAEQLWGDALDTLQRTLDEGREQLVVSEGKNEANRFVTFINLREACRRRLSAWSRDHAELLQLYRQQVDPDAATLLATAKQSHDEAQLRRVTQLYFAATAAEEATLLLGDAALARGDFDAARAAWEPLLANYRVSPTAAEKMKLKAGLPWYFALRGEPVTERFEELYPNLIDAQASVRGLYPATKTAPADVQVRLLLASLLSGDVRRAKWEFELFRRLHPTAEGRLGGKRGLYVKLLEERFTEPIAEPPTTQEWTTFAGSFDRRGIARGDLDIAGTPLWTSPLAKLTSDRDMLGMGKLRVAEDHRALLSYFPILVNDKVLLAEDRTVRAYHVSTGKIVWQLPLAMADEPADPLTSRQVGVPRFTLSVAEGVIALTLPAPMIPTRRAPTVRRDDQSRMVAIEQTTNKLIFEALSEDATWVFEGSPVIDQGKLYVMQRQLSDVRPRVFVACFDLATGQRDWQRFVCSAESLGHGNLVEYANGLLTLSHKVLYCNTNLGAVAALSVEDGSIRWLTRYPRATYPAPRPDRSDRHFFRDLNPCLPHGEQLLCAPSDSERIFSLDINSGDLLWSAPPGAAADAIHLLGVADDYLLASGDCLYWIDLLRGNIVTQFPQAKPVGMGNALPSPRGWGRGVIVGSKIFWPTENAIHIFATQPHRTGLFYEPQGIGEIDLKLRKTTGGNLAFARERLIMATSEQLILFGPQPGQPAVKRE